MVSDMNNVDGGLSYYRSIMTVTTTRIFEFACAHNLQYHEGKCRFFHGHNYKLHVTVSLPKDTPTMVDTNDGNSNNKSQLGMVTDFGNLKKIVNEVILDKYDHSLLIWTDDPSKEKNKFIRDIKTLIMQGSDHDLQHSNIHIVSYRPTAENMCVEFFKELEKPIKEQLGVMLVAIRIYETDNSYAECAIRESEY